MLKRALKDVSVHAQSKHKKQYKKKTNRKQTKRKRANARKKTHKNKTKYNISLYIIMSLAVFFYSFIYKCRADFSKRSNISFPDTYYSFYQFKVQFATSKLI